MRISNKQKQAVEKITGKSWDSFSPEAIESYFAFTDRGERTDLFNRVWKLQLSGNKFSETEQSLWDLMYSHTFHPVDVESWKEGFRDGTVFLSDFLEPEFPKAYIEHAFEVYESALGYVPKCYREHPLGPRGIL